MLISHGEENVVLLRDVFPQQCNEPVRMRNQLFHSISLVCRVPLERIVHGADLRTSLFVLCEHHGNGTRLPGKPFLHHRGKEECLFLCVVTFIGKRSEKVEGSGEACATKTDLVALLKRMEREASAKSV
jgi:hypothetical protein